MLLAEKKYSRTAERKMGFLQGKNNFSSWKRIKVSHADSLSWN